MKNLKLFYALLLALFVFYFFIFAQSKDSVNLTHRNVRVDAKRPTVYLEFVRIEKRTETTTLAANSESVPIKKTQEIEAVILKLYNNSAWAIQLRTSMENFPKTEKLQSSQDKRLMFFLQNDSEQELTYGVEPVNSEAAITIPLKQKLPYTRIYGSTSDLWLATGKSVSFAVNRKELTRNLQVFVPFRYEWETSETNKGYDEPQHRVYFAWDKFENAAGL